MPRRPPQLNRVLATVSVVFGVLALGLLWWAAPLGMSGLELDPDLRIEPGSVLPATGPTVGDQVVAVEGQAVHSQDALAAALRRADSQDVNVTVAAAPVEQSRSVDLAQWDAGVADALATATIVRVGERSVEPGITPSEVRAMIEAAGSSVEVVSRELGPRISGSLRVERRPHSPLILGWLALGVIGIAAAGFVAARRLTRNPIGLPLAAVALGAVAEAALTASVLGGVDPGVTGFGLAMLSVALGAPLVAGNRDGDDARWALGLGPAAVAVFVAVWVAVSGASVSSAGEWMAMSRHATLGLSAVVFGYALAHVLTAHGPLRVARVVALSVAAIVLGGVAVGGASIPAATLWAALVYGAFAWALSVHAALGEGVPRAGRRAFDEEDLSLAGALTILAEAVPEGCHAEAVAGVDHCFVRARRGVGGDVQTTSAPEELTGAFAMLALEGGMFPRHARVHGTEVVEDDPFAEWGARLGLLAAIPLGAIGNRGGVASFAAVFRDEGDASLDLAAFAELVEEVDSPRVGHELVALASERMLRAARRTSEVSGAMPRVTLPPAPTAQEPLAPAQAPLAEVDSDSDAWCEHLTEEVRRAYPVDDPEALDDREWLALAFLRETIQPALIVGEPGVGKEFVARAVHEAMWGATRRFAVLDCALRPPSIVELELFGDGDTPGLVKLVGDGTLLVKGVTALSGERLAAVVDRLSRARARVVFAERYIGPEEGVPSNIPDVVRAAVEDRNIHLSPLRDRPEDITRYAHYFAHRAGMRYGAMVTGIGSSALAWLREQTLAANFHELRALVYAAVLRCDGDALQREDFAGDSIDESGDADLSDEEREERDAIARALRDNDGNRTHTADALKMSRGALLRRLRKYGLD